MSLKAEHIHKSFGQLQVIVDLSMEVAEGDLFGFLGPNGAGKTTTMRMILDISRPDSGQITSNGKPVREVPRRTWGYLPEERGLYPKMEVEERLLFLASQLTFLETAYRLGLTSAQTSSLFAPPDLTVVRAQGNRSTSEIATGYVLAFSGGLLIYIAVAVYANNVAMGVAEEKSSRVMEILVNFVPGFPPAHIAWESCCTGNGLA
jgi:ABC-type sugar transport system ATPase subunit